MRVLFTILVLTLAIAALPAWAEDLDPPADLGESAVPTKHDWTGFYVGVAGGFASGGSDAEFDIRSDEPGLGESPELEEDSASKLFGAGIGYDIEVGNFVFGATGDVQTMD